MQCAETLLTFVTPAEAGVQTVNRLLHGMLDTGFRRYDGTANVKKRWTHSTSRMLKNPLFARRLKKVQTTHLRWVPRRGAIRGARRT